LECCVAALNSTAGSIDFQRVMAEMAVMAKIVTHLSLTLFGILEAAFGGVCGWLHRSKAHQLIA
jgi:hypothetical protein